MFSTQKDSSCEIGLRFSRGKEVRLRPAIPAFAGIASRGAEVSRHRTDVITNRLVASLSREFRKHCTTRPQSWSLLQIPTNSSGSFCEFVGLTSCKGADLWHQIKIDLDTFFMARRLHSTSFREWPALRPTDHRRQKERSNRQRKGTKPC